MLGKCGDNLHCPTRLHSVNAATLPLLLPTLRAFQNVVLQTLIAVYFIRGLLPESFF